MEVNIVYPLAVVAILVWFYHRLTRVYGYFHEKPIPSMAARPMFGSTKPVLTKKCSFNEFIKKIYDQYEGVKCFGLFDANQRFFVLRDPELIKKVAVKDFDHFVDRRPMFGDRTSENSNIMFLKTLVGLKDQRWKDMRGTLSPAFTGSKMRAMFELITEYSERMVQVVRGEAAESGYVDQEMKDFFRRIANDIIATCAFGLQVESFKNRDNEFFTMGKEMLNFKRAFVIFRMIAFKLFPGIMSKLNHDIIGKKQLEYFTRIIRDTVETREARGIVRPDMIQLLMEARKGTLKHQQESSNTGAGFATVEESHIGQATSNRAITEPELIAQCLIFFLAGFDTISTVFTFMAYELALNQDVQQKLHQEVVQTNNLLKGKPLTYDALQTLTYLDMVVSECLRKWPAPAIDRLCVKDYVLDDGEGLKFTIDKGACVWFPVHGIHRDPKYYPDPERFDPERFSETNRASINPAAYMPFGVGPRNCIGSRFALMEIKAIVYQLLLSFSFERTEQTEVPIQLAKGFVNLASENGVHLRLKLRV
ncbi:probable cytochrome P450 9f2 [Culex quinquefasciatus]|uniref:probable cytochrome P450 9f2 n=1 Tax=Culex quinquefasciatus TaxID=7176 RepID=UPI0018E3D5F8|nr:probable cytochrome P450 9f2 [Culex quinquefasciatus]